MTTAILLSASVATPLASPGGAPRSYDSVILKPLGVTRWPTSAAEGLEHALLAAALCLLALSLLYTWPLVNCGGNARDLSESTYAT